MLEAAKFREWCHIWALLMEWKLGRAGCRASGAYMVLKTDEIICWRLQSLGSGVT
jgi:hypothetical protein